MISRKKAHRAHDSILSMIKSTYNLEGLLEINMLSSGHYAITEAKSVLEKQKVRILRRTTNSNERRRIIENKEASSDELIALAKNPYCSEEELENIMYHKNLKEARIYLNWLNRQNAKKIKHFVETKEEINLPYLGKSGNNTVKTILIQDSRIDSQTFNQLIQEGDAVRQEKAFKNPNIGELLNLASMLTIIKNTYNIQRLEEIERRISGGRFDTVDVRAVIKKQREPLLQRTDSEEAIHRVIKDSETSFSELMALARNPYCSEEELERIMKHKNMRESVYIKWLKKQKEDKVKCFIRSKEEIDFQYWGKNGNDVIKKVLIQDDGMKYCPNIFEEWMQGSEEVKKMGLRNPELEKIAMSKEITLDTLDYILQKACEQDFYSIMRRLRHRHNLEILNLILKNEIWDRNKESKCLIKQYVDVVRSVISTEGYEKGNNTELIVQIYEKVYFYICEQYGSWWHAGEEVGYEVYDLGRTMLERLSPDMEMHKRIAEWNKKYEKRERTRKETEKRATPISTCSCDFSFIEERYIRSQHEPKPSDGITDGELFMQILSGGIL